MKNRMIQYVATAAACLACVFTVGLNTSPAFAAYAGEIPVIGQLAQILTVRNYNAQDENVHYHIRVPEVTGDGEFAKQINKQITDSVNLRVAEAEQYVADYKDAFLSTGGTMEEWESRGFEIYVDYEIKSQKDNVLSFVVTACETNANSFAYQYFYNLDMTTEKTITLEEMLGKDYIAICNEQITAQIAENSKDEYQSYFTPEEGGFTSIDENTDFYINENGNVVIVFPKYAIAPGYMGIEEFEITQ